MRSHARRLALVLSSTAIAAVGILLAADPAGAVVKKIEVAPGTTTEVGLQPRENEALHEGTPTASQFANTGEGAVLHSNQTYVIYWDPTDHYHGDWQGLIDTFMQGLGAESGSPDNVFAVDSQYTDTTNQPASYRSTFMGAYTDTNQYPVSGCTDPAPLTLTDQLVIEGFHTPVCLTDEQIREELKAFIALHGLPKGMGSIYYLLTPPGVTVCVDEEAGHCSDYSGSEAEASYLDSFCSYHSDINPDAANPEVAKSGDGNTILYSVVPWTAGGQGDYHLEAGDQTSGYACQDGGFDPSTNPPEEKEHAKEKSKKEKEELKKRRLKKGRRSKKPNDWKVPTRRSPTRTVADPTAHRTRDWPT